MKTTLWARFLPLFLASVMALLLGLIRSPKAAPAARDAATRTTSPAAAVSARIISKAPQGLVTGNTELQVGFDQPMVPLGAEVSPVGLAITVQPAVKGRLRWSAPNLLVFEPEALAPATHYTARLQWRGNTRCPISDLDMVGTWAFETPGPELEGVAARGDLQVAEQRPLVIRLSQPTKLAELASHLRISWWPASYGFVEDSDSVQADPRSNENDSAQSELPPVRTPIAVRVERGAALDLSRSLENDAANPTGNQVVFLVYPRKPWPRSATVSIELLPGLRGQLGPVPSRGNTMQAYTEAGLQISSVTCDPGDGCVLGESLSVDFGTEVPKSELAKLRFEPRPSDFEVRFADQQDEGASVTVQGVFLAGETYRLTVPADLRDSKGHRLAESTGGKDVTLTFPFTTRSLLVVGPNNGVFARHKRATIGVQTRFVSSLSMSALQLSDEAAYQALIPQADPHAVRFPELPLVMTRDLVEQGPNGWSEQVVDLDDLVKGKRGVFAFEARAMNQGPRAVGGLPKPVTRFYQRTDLAPIVWTSPRRLAALVLHHSDLKPVPGADASLFTEAEPHGLAVGRTDTRGMLVVPIRDGLGKNPLLVTSEASTQDRSYSRLPRVYEQESRDSDSSLRSGESVTIHATVERDLLRPGDSVHVLGWALIDSPEAATGLRHLPPGVPTKLELWDGSHKVVGQKGVRTDAFGKFYAELQVPRDAGLGRAHVLVSIMGREESVPIRVEDVRPPAFQVSVSTPEAVLRGQPISIDVAATQLSGESTTISSVSLNASCRGHGVAPIPLPEDWTAEFGRSSFEYPSKKWRKQGPVVTGRYADSVSSAALADPDYPSTCSVDAEVTNQVREHIGSTSSTLVHPAPHYLAMRHLQGFNQAPEDPIIVVLGAFDVQGRRVSVGTVELTAITDARKPNVVARCSAQVTADVDAACKLGTLAAGDYRVVAKGRRGSLVGIDSALRVFAPQATQPTITPEPKTAPSAPKEAEPSLRMSVPDRPMTPGERLTAWIGASNDGYGVLIVERSGIREQHTFQVRNGRASVSLTVKESWVPEVQIQAAMPLRQQDASRVDTAYVSQHLAVLADKRALQVQINAPTESRPGTRIPIEFAVRDSAGHPQPARLAVWAVDEAYLQLTDYVVVHPLSRLIPQARHEVRLFSPFADVVEPYVPIGKDPSLNAESLSLSGFGTGAGGLGGAAGLGGIAKLGLRQRTHFNPVPLYIADLATDATGKARVTLALPDDLTRFRITALAAASMFDNSPGRFGKADTAIRVTQPVVLRAAMPRLLRPSDHAEVAAIAKNLTDSDGVLDISARLVGTNGAPVAQLVSDAHVKRPIRAGEEVRAPFQVEARRAGNAKLELSAILHVSSKSGDDGDALQLPLVVEAEPAVINRSAVYITLQPQESRSLAISVPSGTAPGGGVTVNAATSLLAETLDAASYLVDYPHGCAEQTASAILGLLAYRELRAHGVAEPVIPEQTLQDRVKRLLSMQTTKGGFSYWPGEQLVDDPHVSPYALWVLARAQESGVAIPGDALERARKYVNARFSQATRAAKAPFLAEAAFAAQALVLAGGKPQPADIDGLYGKRAALEPSSVASLLLAIHGLSPGDNRVGALADVLAGSVMQTPGAASIATPSSLHDYDPFVTSTRTHALVTLALFTARPDHPLVGKLLRGLLDLRAGGRWRNTQENAFALVVASEMARRESRSNHARVRVLAGAATLLDADVSAKTPASALLARDTLHTAADHADSVELKLNLLDGGPVHVRVASAWNMATAQPRSAGIELERTLSQQNAGQDVTSVKEGSTLWCNIQLRNRVPLHYVAVTLPLPAGVEGMLDLGSGAGARPGGERPAWVSHQEIWKDRIVLFADSLEPGKHLDSLPLRVVTPGDYVVPAALGEAMYEPEIQTVTPSARLRVLHQ